MNDMVRGNLESMSGVRYIDRDTGEIKEEPVYCYWGMRILYGTCVGRFLAYILSVCPLFSRCVGCWFRSRFSRGKIQSFVQQFAIKEEEFARPVSTFSSFHEFFIRHLRKEARPIDERQGRIVAPADGCYRVYPCCASVDEIRIKGQRFSLVDLLQSSELAERYYQGSMLIARLAIFDYHRFHFPFECIPDQARLVNGRLRSVHPLAMRDRLDYLSENKRTMTTLRSAEGWEGICVEVGALNVGSIVQTYRPGQLCKKGEEKGYFALGGSTIVLLFPEHSVRFDEDLLAASQQGLELRCRVGQSIARQA